MGVDKDTLLAVLAIVIILILSIVTDRRIQQDKQIIESLQKEIQQLKENK